MIRIAYGNEGHSMRRIDLIRIDRRDLVTRDDGSIAPHPAAMPHLVGKQVGEDNSHGDGHPGFVLFEHVDAPPLAPGEKLFDHLLSDAELEQEFPGYADRLKQMRAVASLRAAIAMAGHDDELAAHVAAGALKASDLHDLVEINARLRLRGKAEIA
jgi:hypothetical protein